MTYRLIHLGPWRILLARPDVRDYGQLAIDILLGLHEAQRLRASLYFIRPLRVANSALFELQSSSVNVIRSRWWLSVLLVLLRAIPAWLVALRSPIVDPVVSALARYFSEKSKNPKLNKLTRGALKECSARVAAYHSKRWVRRAVAQPLPFRRSLVRERLQVHLRPAQQRAAERQAAELGVHSDAKIVTLHVREPWLKPGRDGRGVPDNGRDDSVRNARIDSYFRAIDYLVDLGYTVVRIGDPNMTPIDRPGVLDLATSPQRTDALEVYFLLRSTFLIGCEAGPSIVSYLTNTPCLVVNATDPIGSYPIRNEGIYVLKHVIDREQGRTLSLSEMLSEHYLRHIGDRARFEYVDNDPKEILPAVQEMVALLDDRVPDLSPQRAFRERATRAAVTLRDRVPLAAQWGVDEGSLGDGRIGRAYLKRADADAPEPTMSEGSQTPVTANSGATRGRGAQVITTERIR